MAKFKAKKSEEKASEVMKQIIKEKRIRSDEETEAIRFVVILIVVLLVVVGVYFLSKVIVNKRESQKEQAKITINHDIVTVGTMLSKKDDNYYVLIYDEDNMSESLYSQLLNTYKSSQKLPIYYCNLGNNLNKKYVAKDGKSNPDATKVSEFAFGEITLIEVNNGKIKNYYEDIKDITDKLSVS